MFSQSLVEYSEAERDSFVELQNQLVPLLSEQLYRSPIKAIEELVVNAYDAQASNCHLFVPTPNDIASVPDRRVIVVFDDGEGMTADAIVNLWQVGYSPKSDTRSRLSRKQIGKFGIGKLATYAVADQLTYITKAEGTILTSSLDFRQLAKKVTTDPKHAAKAYKVAAPIRRITKWKDLLRDEFFRRALDLAHVDHATLYKRSWTITILEDLKPKASKIQEGRLRWVLSTAMPLKSDFKLFLNGESVESSKVDPNPIVAFDVGDLTDDRLKGLSKETSEQWERKGKLLVSKSFPGGVHGQVVMTERSLVGKSDDLQHSHGFFVRVRGRLVNLEDPLFGTTALSHKYFNRFRADVHADDLDDVVVAGREGVELSDLRHNLVALLRELFAQARQTYDERIDEREDKTRQVSEERRDYVPPSIVEHPLADVLAVPNQLQEGADADSSWFYLDVPATVDIKDLVRRLYTEPREKYRFQYEHRGRADRIVKFNPSSSTFTVNADHEFIQRHLDDGEECLKDFVIAETLLEVYLREEGVSQEITGEILQRRDDLLRSLSVDRLQSPRSIARFVRDSASSAADLEIALVVAARALGFVATHVSGPDNPDGIAKWVDHPRGERRITLEAKSSEEVPRLSAIDFAVLQSHMEETEGATGCLLVAPAYPGWERRGEYSRAARIAKKLKISCWTIEELAQVVEAAEKRRITAEQVVKIVETCFTPGHVRSAVRRLLSDPPWDQEALMNAVVQALRRMEDKLKDAPRSIEMLATTVSLTTDDLKGVKAQDVRKALVDLAAASKGALAVSSDQNTVHVFTSIDELERRAAGVLRKNGTLRKPGTFTEPSG